MSFNIIFFLAKTHFRPFGPIRKLVTFFLSLFSKNSCVTIFFTICYKLLFKNKKKNLSLAQLVPLAWSYKLLKYVFVPYFKVGYSPDRANSLCKTEPNLKQIKLLFRILNKFNMFCFAHYSDPILWSDQSISDPIWL